MLLPRCQPAKLPHSLQPQPGFVGQVLTAARSLGKAGGTRQGQGQGLGSRLPLALDGPWASVMALPVQAAGVPGQLWGHRTAAARGPVGSIPSLPLLSMCLPGAGRAWPMWTSTQVGEVLAEDRIGSALLATACSAWQNLHLVMGLCHLEDFCQHSTQARCSQVCQTGHGGRAPGRCNCLSGRPVSCLALPSMQQGLDVVSLKLNPGTADMYVDILDIGMTRHRASACLDTGMLIWRQACPQDACSLCHKLTPTSSCREWGLHLDSVRPSTCSGALRPVWQSPGVQQPLCHG